MFVGDLMTKNLVTVLPETSLADAARIMLARHLSGLLVLDKSGQLVGVITEGDLLRRAELGTQDDRANWLKVFLMPGGLAADYVKTHGRFVSEVMTANPVSVTPQTELAVAATLMRKRHIKRLAVILDGTPVGVISRSDLLGALALKLIQTASAKPSDAAICADIQAGLAKESWAPKTGIRVVVKNAVVALEGVVMSDGERRAVKVIAENAAGVAGVKDHLVFIDPGSGMAFPAGGV
jgi:CBS domain-containing protein